jgi:DNA polymerase I-like protein with 3'-5' exonuclease and polymerase domains
MPRDVRYRIEADSPAELQEYIDNYKNTYPTIAYDTRVVSKTEEDGKHTAIVSRLSSCD